MEDENQQLDEDDDINNMDNSNKNEKSKRIIIKIITKKKI